MSYVLFVSYSRVNTKTDISAKAFRQFLTDLEDELSNRINLAPDEEWSFIDARDIELGAPWPDDLARAVISSRVCLAFYSKQYFVSDWCGKEFEVFRRRGARIFPVLWGPPALEVLQSVKDVEYVNDNFPKEYRDKGLRQLVLQQERSAGDYRECVRLFGESIEAEYNRNAVRKVALDLATVKSAWEPKTPAGATAQPPIAISKACFVFFARGGWHWKPYPAAEETVGALSQLLSGKLGLQYEEIPVDAQLATNLRGRTAAKAPTLIFAEPSSLLDDPFAGRMREYDYLNMLNTGALLAWPEGSESGNKPEWNYIQQLCPQKTSFPPPFHEWTGISSQSELKEKALAALEGIRLRLLQQMLSPDSGATVRQAVSADASKAAAGQGIRLEAAPQLAAATPKSGN